MKNNLLQSFSSVFESDLIAEIIQHANYFHFEKEDFIIDFEQKITYIPLVINGIIKILREDTHGNELLLYYIESGESCVVSLHCCSSNYHSTIRAIADTEVDLLMIPVKFMDHFMTQYSSWRNFVLNSYQKRFEDMLVAIDTLAFMNIEERILKYIENKVQLTKTNIIYKTHHEIAQEINSSRVVVSRILKKLELNGKIKQERQRIEWLEIENH